MSESDSVEQVRSTTWPPMVVPQESSFYTEARQNCERMRAQYPLGYSPADEQLLLAYEYQDGEAFLTALKNGADPDLKNMEWTDSLLEDSVYHGCPEVTELLLNAGADPTVDDGSLLFALVDDGPTSLLQRVITQYNLSPNAVGGCDYMSLVAHAASAGRMDCLKMLRECGADMHAHDGIALCMACRYNHPEAVYYLVHECQAPLEVEYDDHSPLFYAAREDAFECARILLEAGADPNHADITGRTPFHYAKSDNMHMLLSRFARPMRRASTKKSSAC